MTKILFSLALGLILGAIREILVVKYQVSVIDLRPRLGAGSTWGIGHIDFLVYFALATFNNPWVFLGWIYGETIASYWAIKRRKDARRQIL